MFSQPEPPDISNCDRKVGMIVGKQRFHRYVSCSVEFEKNHDQKSFDDVRDGKESNTSSVAVSQTRQHC